MHEIQYNDDILDNNAEALWKEYGDDITEYIVGYFGNGFDQYFDITAATIIPVDVPYDVYELDHPWCELMCEAMQANAESLFDAEGPCDIYGELL